MANPRLFRVALEIGDPDAAGRFYRALLDVEPRPVGGGRVDDLEAYHRRAEELGCLSAAEVHGESGGKIAVRPWGERSFYAEDPWGNGLCFVERGTRFTGR